MRTTDLPRVLGLWDTTCVVVGAIVGVGIFFTPRDVALVTGSAGSALLAWSLGGLVALLGAFTFAELGRLRPLAGGQYHVLREAYGRAPAFLFVFCNLPPCRPARSRSSRSSARRTSVWRCTGGIPPRRGSSRSRR